VLRREARACMALELWWVYSSPSQCEEVVPSAMSIGRLLACLRSCVGPGFKHTIDMPTTIKRSIWKELCAYATGYTVCLQS